LTCPFPRSEHARRGLCLGIAIQCKGFPLAGERGLYADANERMLAFVQMCWYGLLNDGWEGCGVMMWRDMGSGEDGCIVAGRVVMWWVVVKVWG